MIRPIFALILTICLILQTGCDFNKKERLAAETQLELARSKGDLDGMFTAVKTLQNLGDKSQARSDELAKVQAAITKLQTIRLNVKEGKDAQALVNAEALLKSFPTHEEVRGIIATLEKSKADRLATFQAAKTRLDLDSMQTVLKELESGGQLSEGTKKELEDVNACVVLTQKIKVAQGAHNHEEVVNLAGEILAIYPKQPEAIRAFKESGLIFQYLQEALQNMNRCFTNNSDKNLPQLVTTRRLSAAGMNKVL